MKAKCCVCDRAVQVVTPSGGDGSYLRILRHPKNPKDRALGACEGSFHLVSYSELEKE